MLSCAHIVSCDSPGEFGKLSSASNRSAGPTLGVHSAWACQAARSSVQDNGLHSSELAVRLAKEYGKPCRTRSCSLWLMMRLKMAWAPGAVRVVTLFPRPLPAVPFWLSPTHRPLGSSLRCCWDGVRVLFRLCFPYVGLLTNAMCQVRVINACNIIDH